MSYVQPKEGSNIRITIYSDDAYHSQDPEELANHPNKRFHSHKTQIQNVPKTGLGSSAALTSVVTAALLHFYLPEQTASFSDKATLQRIHNLAQLAHCTAQKKVGSGFDVASAVCGSIIYRRFPASVLGNLTSPEDFTSEEYAQKVKELVDVQDWNVRLDSCTMPPGLTLLMGDVCGGSETPKLVNMVLAWRKEKPERSLEVWTKLDNANMELVKLLNDFTEQSKSDSSYNKLLDDVKTHKSSELKENEVLGKFVDTFSKIRVELKAMTNESGAPIEPQEQTTILDACSELPGVLGGVVPGAGGYDAICLLAASSAVETIKKETASHQVLSSIKWLDLKEQNVGLKFEDPSIYAI